MSNNYTETKTRGIINKINTSQISSMTFEADEFYLAPDNAVYSVNNVTPTNGNVNIPEGANKDLSNLTSTGNAKFQAPITGGASTITSSNLTTNRALVSNSSGKVTVSSVTLSELGYVSGVTSKIQTQLDNKLSNTGTGTNALGIMGTATGNRGVGIGQAAEGSGSYSSGLGTGAKATGNYAIQLGYGTNSTASTLSVGFNASSSADRKNWQLLDGSTGLIPDARLSTNIAKTSDIKNSMITITQGGVTKGSFTLNQSSSDTIALDAGGGGSSRNIGEIVTSTIPLTDAGLHLLNGSLLQYASYKDFIDYIADLYDSGNYTDIFETEANWQTAVTTYGVCGKFVYDSANNTVRLPKITGFIEGASGTTTLGDVTGAGLPNITGSTDETGTIGLVSRTGSTQTGAFTKGENRAYAPSGSTSVAGSMLGFDASLSNSIYGNSNTVQPQSTKVLYYIVITNTTKTAIEVDIDEIATDLNGKADTDLSNVANTSGLRRLVKSGISGTAWYKIYSEYDYATGNYIGLWAECGDLYYAGSTTAGDHTIVFPFVADDYQFTNTNYYTVMTSVSHSATNLANYGCYEKYASRTKYTTVLRVIGAWFGYSWTACGYVEITS